MTYFKIKFGPVCLAFGPNTIVLAPRARRFRGRHFTLLGDQNVLKPHVTQPGRGRWRKFLPAVPVATFRKFFENIGRDLHEMWCEASTQTTPEALDAADWILIGTDDQAGGRFLENEVDQDGVFTLRASTMLKFGEVMLDSADTPLRLHDLKECGRLLTLARATEDGGLEARFVAFYANGLAGRPPDWYVTPTKWLDDERFEETLILRAGPSLWNAMLLAQRWLGLGDPHWIEQMRAKARAT